MIQTVKLQGYGYLLNGTMSVPNDPLNSEYQLIQEWIKQGNTPEPEFTQEELDAMALAKTKAEAQAYLTKTDHKFYGDYEPKDGEDLEAIRVKRSEARTLLRGETSTEVVYASVPN